MKRYSNNKIGKTRFLAFALAALFIMCGSMGVSSVLGSETLASSASAADAQALPAAPAPTPDMRVNIRPMLTMAPITTNVAVYYYDRGKFSTENEEIGLKFSLLQCEAVGEYEFAGWLDMRKEKFSDGQTDAPLLLSENDTVYNPQNDNPNYYNIMLMAIYVRNEEGVNVYTSNPPLSYLLLEDDEKSLYITCRADEIKVRDFIALSRLSYPDDSNTYSSDFFNVREKGSPQWDYPVYYSSFDNLDDLVTTGSVLFRSQMGSLMTMWQYTSIEGKIIVIMMDVNGDGKVNTRDILYVQKHVLEIESLEGEYLYAADTRNDGNINSATISDMQKSMLGLD